MVQTWMIILVLFIILQRILELIIAKSNEQWLLERGGIEKGQSHYKWFIYLHILFIMSILFEGFIFNTAEQSLNFYLLTIFFIVQIGRVWCILSLGRFWNTKVVFIPGVLPIQSGPYKYVKHPNYIIVAIELFVIPLLFGAYITAFIFPILHLILLRIRVPIEERALKEMTNSFVNK